MGHLFVKFLLSSVEERPTNVKDDIFGFFGSCDQIPLGNRKVELDHVSIGCGRTVQPYVFQQPVRVVLEQAQPPNLCCA